MVTYDIGGNGIVFTNKRIICDARNMSDEALEHIIKEHENWKIEQNAKKAERREKLTGYVNQIVEYVKSYFK